MEAVKMRKSIIDVIEETIINHVKQYIYDYNRTYPTIKDIDDIINYYYSDDIQKMLLDYGIYKKLYMMKYEIKE